MCFDSVAASHWCRVYDDVLIPIPSKRYLYTDTEREREMNTVIHCKHIFLWSLFSLPIYFHERTRTHLDTDCTICLHKSHRNRDSHGPKYELSSKYSQFTTIYWRASALRIQANQSREFVRSLHVIQFDQIYLNWPKIHSYYYYALRVFILWSCPLNKTDAVLWQNVPFHWNQKLFPILINKSKPIILLAFKLGALLLVLRLLLALVGRSVYTAAHQFCIHQYKKLIFISMMITFVGKFYEFPFDNICDSDQLFKWN